jgi:hypothetical protein
MRDFTTELYIHHDVRKIPRVDGNGASLVLCIAWWSYYFGREPDIGRACVIVLEGCCKYAYGLCNNLKYTTLSTNSERISRHCNQTFGMIDTHHFDHVPLPSRRR